ncbi:ribonucleotide reductase inhibitor-domain-containing protein [Halenospora varia]|nr:ribonucleotide reductase inhibitor-domain-containing protein [Halenospora varia]
MATTHQHKRPYAGSQPSITSYFPPSDPNTPINYSISSPSTPLDGTTPPLPDSIRANLISVGMRVRKSVPEGYQTVPKNTFAMFSDPSSPSTTNPPSLSEGYGVKKQGTRPRARELTPFCGILKVGGMATQAWGIYNPHAHGKDLEEMEMEEEGGDECEWHPVSSQDSAVSMGYDQHSHGFGNTHAVNANKRRFEDEGLEIDDTPIHTFGFGHNERRIAIPKRRAGGLGAPPKVPVHGGAFAFGQENAGFGTPGDFEDAEFLDYGLVKEVEMGGV